MQDKFNILLIAVGPGASSNILLKMLFLEKNSNQGFSLLESMIAIVILGILMTGGLAFYYQANALYYRGLHYQMASWIADTRMEQIRNAGCSAAGSLTGMGTDISTGTSVSLAGLTGLRKVSLPGCSASNDVTVLVKWTEPGEAVNSYKHTVSLETNVGQ